MRERLIELLNQIRGDEIALMNEEAEILIDHLLANGVIVPPCKGGDVVYILDAKRPCFACDFCDDYCHKNCRFDDRAELVVKEATVCRITVEKDGYISYEVGRNKTVGPYSHFFRFDDFGKTVFLTKKEAEAALEERTK